MTPQENLTVISSPEGEGRGARSFSAQKIAEAEDRHFWHASRNRFIEGRLRALNVAPPARILDLGCGGGSVAAHLAGAGFGVVGVEGDMSLATRAARKAPNAQFFVADIAEGVDDLGLDRFDVVGLYDVIEHLDDPRRTLDGAISACKHGGFVTGTVPALRSLWSTADDRAGHKLRYERRDLLALCASVPSSIVREVSYFNRPLVPFVWAHRRFVARPSTDDYLDVPPEPINRALYAMVLLEQRLAPILDRTPLLGASLWFALERS